MAIHKITYHMYDTTKAQTLLKKDVSAEAIIIIAME